MYTYHYDSKLGGITLASDGEGISGLWFDGQKYFGDVLEGSNSEMKRLDVFDEAEEWLNIYFSGHVPNFTPKLKLTGSEFRLSVWNALLTIPYGHTMTYSEIAEKLKKGSARSVGGAVAHNPISIIVPCHRVIGSNGNLTGYAGGLERKKELLRLEGIDA